ncbi:mitochondrial acidic protein MAM33 [Telopea speciosissima]|uniref:mitochondrial acidic protein MAM33 n=1 Tax=Telopea speciosissima TaxID=54955 RepID=UPI001CC7F3B2|nr:mitochondrial acidic protein MAM33 [Telopea speciosissima]
MTRLVRFFSRNCRALRDGELLRALQSELKYEESSKPFQGHLAASLGDFVLDWDSPQSKDVVLRRRFDSGEEIAISALLGPEADVGEGLLPMQVLMKICIKKPGLSPTLQFDCGISSSGDNESEFAVHNAYYRQSLSCSGASEYKGCSYSLLDPQLQDAFKEYLISRGIGKDLTNFLLLHMHKKEQGQYVNWLQKLEAMVAKDA